MKTAEEWMELTAPLIKAIQSDALKHAASIARARNSDIKVASYNCACDEIALFIEAEAERLDAE